jgi:1-aminocyclopropane-1-carboxylate deaminase/D-cysteine desulfhydrase-like pyridoxal-dependent ACC family enzyme
MQLTVKRLDLLHPEAPGNKYFKLKYNILKAREKGAERIVTVGGAFSNHLHATAASCRQAEISCIGIVRGEEMPVLTETLRDCVDMGMQLEFMEREAYDECSTEAFKQQIHARYPMSYFIPEGGSNYLGINGCMEILNDDDRMCDTLAVPVGTGTTLAGLLLTAGLNQRILAFPALNDFSLPERLQEALYWTTLDEELAAELAARVEWKYAYTCGGFAKMNDALRAFIHDQQLHHNLPLDRVYTAKMMMGLYDLHAKGEIKTGERVRAIHTGGLQGNRGLVKLG